jgi:hypothetical protein
MLCPRCGKQQRNGELVCTICGYVERPTATAVLKVDPNTLRSRRSQTIPSVNVSHGSVVLRIRGMMEKFDIDALNNLIIGRSDLERGFQPGLDLAPYGGVSRAHATLNYKNDQLTVTDLNSANGTLLNGERLAPEQSYLLKDGDELILGRLPISVNLWLDN